MAVKTSSPKKKLIDITYIAAATALIVVCSWITIPSPVPFTLQTFGIFAVLSMIGGRRGTLAVLSYIIIGAAGLPVFSNFGGGITWLAGPTGGYIVGFLLIALIYALAEKLSDKTAVRAAALAVGLIVCYAFGTAWFMAVYARTSGEIGLSTALGWCVFPFVLPDAAKLALAVIIARVVRRHIKLPE